MVNVVIKKYVNGIRSVTSNEFTKEDAIKQLDYIDQKYSKLGASTLRIDSTALTATLNGVEMKWLVESVVTNFKEVSVDSKTAKLLIRDRYRVVRYDDGNIIRKTNRYTKRTADKILQTIRLSFARAEMKLIRRRAGVRVYSRMYDTVVSGYFQTEFEEGRKLTITFDDGHVTEFKVESDPY